MDWLKQLLEKAEVKDGKLDVDSVVATINKEFPKYAVPKETFNSTNEQLKTANTTIADLKKNNTDNEALQNTINTYKTDIDSLKTTHAKELKELKINAAINDILVKNNAIHADLLTPQFKKENINFNEDGTITGLQEQFDSIKERFKDQFKEVSTDGNESDGTNTNSSYKYVPSAGGEAKPSSSFLDIILENQARK